MARNLYEYIETPDLDLLTNTGNYYVYTQGYVFVSASDVSGDITQLWLDTSIIGQFKAYTRLCRNDIWEDWKEIITTDAMGGQLSELTTLNKTLVPAINELKNAIDILDPNVESHNWIGDMSTLSTDTKTLVVNAINEVDMHCDENLVRIGTLGNLQTSTKVSIVNAINELKVIIDHLNPDAVGFVNSIGDVADLLTTAKDTLVNAINELVGYIGDTTTLSTDDKTSLVNSNNELQREIDVNATHIGDLTNLNTEDKTNLVDAINEVIVRDNLFMIANQDALAFIDDPDLIKKEFIVYAGFSCTGLPIANQNTYMEVMAQDNNNFKFITAYTLNDDGTYAIHINAKNGTTTWGDWIKIYPFPSTDDVTFNSTDLMTSGGIYNYIGDLLDLTTADQGSIIDAINEIVTNVSNLSTKIGSLNALTTDVKSSMSSAINEIDAHADINTKNIGYMDKLDTVANTSLVKAINEVNGIATTNLTDVTQIKTDVGDKADLITTSKYNLVAAINEIESETEGALTKIGDVASLTTTSADIVSAINALEARIVALGG